MSEHVTYCPECLTHFSAEDVMCPQCGEVLITEDVILFDL